MRTLKTFFKNEKEGFFSKLKSAQDVIPIEEVCTKNIFRLGKTKYSKTYKFTDINYFTLSKEDKENVYNNYKKIINSLDSNSATKLTIFKHKISSDKISSLVDYPSQNDGLDDYRQERKEMLFKDKSFSDLMIQERYLTVSAHKRDFDESKSFFERIDSELINNFSLVNSHIQELETEERLRLIYDFFHPDSKDFFKFDLHEAMQRGHNFKDSVVPDSFEINKRDYFCFDGYYGRVLVIRDFSNDIYDTIISDLLSVNSEMVLSIDMLPIPPAEAIKEAESRVMRVESNVNRWQRRKNESENYSAEIPYPLEKQREESKKFLDDLMSKDQRMILTTITIAITAKSKEDLDRITDQVCSEANKNSCRLAVLSFQQLEGLNTVLPYGHMKIQCTRTLITEGVAMFMPFRVQDIQDKNGMPYGSNTISSRDILIDRKKMLNGNAFVLGVSGSGKSFEAKKQISDLRLFSDSEIIIIDPEKEYRHLVDKFCGQTIKISCSGNNHINALDINAEYGEDGDPISLKSEFILTLCDQIIGGSSLTGKEKSIIDRCVKSIFSPYRNRYQEHNLTLNDLRQELLRQEEKEAKEVALALELFSSGSLNTFSEKTNVNINNRLVCYDIFDVGEQLLPITMLIILDNIWNRLSENRSKGKTTFIFIDEIYLLFRNKYSATFLYKLWKRIRKYGGFATGITQNVDELLQSMTARTMLANSELTIMLNQASTDKDELAKLFKISDSQLKFITNAKEGSGLIRVGGSIVPFTNKFPHNNLYSLMTTKPSEDFR